MSPEDCGCWLPRWLSSLLGFAYARVSEITIDHQLPGLLSGPGTAVALDPLSLNPPADFVLAVLVGVDFEGVFCLPLTVLRLVRALGWGLGAGCPGGRRGADRVGAGQAAAAGGPQAAWKRLSHSRWRCHPGSADEPNAWCTECQPELGKRDRAWRDAVYLGYRHPRRSRACAGEVARLAPRAT